MYISPEPTLNSTAWSYFGLIFQTNAVGHEKSQFPQTNKLAKARKTRKSQSTLGLKKFGPGKVWVKKVN